jgi:hypothetical protein
LGTTVVNVFQAVAASRDHLLERWGSAEAFGTTQGVMISMNQFARWMFENMVGKQRCGHWMSFTQLPLGLFMLLYWFP